MAEAALLQSSRRVRKKERTRGEIYDAAMNLFARHGYESVTVEMICEAADVARSTFFIHYPAKAALIGEFSRRLSHDFVIGLEHAGRTSAAEELVALVQEIGRRIEAQRQSMLAMIREFILTPAAIEHTRDRERALPDLIEGIVRRGQRSGEFSSRIHPRLATAAILSIASSILSGWVFEDRDIAPGEILRQYLETIFQGLGGKIPRPQTNRKG